ncbi:MAG: DUF3368 domain-containing protein [Candidatus Thorarchaeota archaeon]|nr:DUF3368 domain-containing protein [Candidatus Thorarchaeota archaeon]
MSKTDSVVSNASPLIHLAKAGNLSLLKDMFGEIMIPEEVFKEVCGAQDTPDSVVISDAVNDGWVRIIRLVSGDANLLAKSSGIDIGEAATILLAKKESALLLIDDKMGRSAAEILGVRCLGTVGVLLQALSDSMFKFDEFNAILDRMIDSGFRLDSKVYRLVLKIAKDLDENR